MWNSNETVKIFIGYEIINLRNNSMFSINFLKLQKI